MMITPETHQAISQSKETLSQSQKTFTGHLEDLERANGSIGKIEYNYDQNGQLATLFHPRWSLSRWVYNKLRHGQAHRELHDLAIQTLTSDSTPKDLRLRLTMNIQRGSFPFVSHKEKKLLTENVIRKMVITDRPNRILKAEHKELSRRLPDVDIEHTAEYLQAYCTVALLSPEKLAGKYQTFETLLKNHFREFGQQKQFQALMQNSIRNAISEAVRMLPPEDFLEVMRSAHRVPWGARGRLIYSQISTTLHNNTRAADTQPITRQDMDLITFWGKHFETSTKVAVQSHLTSDLKAIMENEEFRTLENQADALYTNQLKASVDRLKKCRKTVAAASDFSSRQESKEEFEEIIASIQDQLELAQRCRQKLYFINGALLSQWDREVLCSQEYAGKQVSAIYRRLEQIDKIYREVEDIVQEPIRL